MTEESTSEAELEAHVFKMKEALAKQDTTTLKSVMKEIQNHSLALVEVLVPILFETDATSNGTLVSPEEALSLIGCLVSVDAATYLKPVSRAVKVEATLRSASEKQMAVSPELLGVMITQLNGEDVQVSSNATEALVACCRKLGPAVSEPCMQSLTQSWHASWDTRDQDKTTASTICVRYASTVIDLVSLSDQLMASAVSNGAAQLLLEMINYDQDPLLQMSVLDLLEHMATTHPMHVHRAHWLSSETVLQPLLALSGAGTADELGDPNPILGGPALRLLSAICRLGQRDTTVFDQGGKNALLGFHRALQNFQAVARGELDRLALVDAISSFASASPEALDLVLKDPATREAWLSLSVAQPKLKAVILTSVAMVIDPAPERDANGDIVTAANVPTTEDAMRLFSMVGEINSKHAADIVLSVAKSPIPETRLAAYNLMRAVAKTSTGAQVLMSNPEFNRLVIDREGENTKDGREAKYEIVRAIMASPVKSLLAEDIVKSLERILAQGPHHVEPIRPELATE